VRLSTVLSKSVEAYARHLTRLLESVTEISVPIHGLVCVRVEPLEGRLPIRSSRFGPTPARRILRGAGEMARSGRFPPDSRTARDGRSLLLRPRGRAQSRPALRQIPPRSYPAPRDQALDSCLRYRADPVAGREFRNDMRNRKRFGRSGEFIIRSCREQPRPQHEAAGQR